MEREEEGQQEQKTFLKMNKEVYIGMLLQKKS